MLIILIAAFLVCTSRDQFLQLWDQQTCLSCMKEEWQRCSQLSWQGKSFSEVPKSPPTVLPANLQTIMTDHIMRGRSWLIEDRPTGPTNLTKSNPATTSGKSFFSWIASVTAALTSETLRALKKATRDDSIQFNFSTKWLRQHEIKSCKLSTWLIILWCCNIATL